MGMDYLTVVTAAGKSLFVESDYPNRRRIVRREKVATTTGTQAAHPKVRRQQFYLTLAAPFVK
jgi:hypothetical protein